MNRWRLLWRLVLIVLGVRRITPGLWERPGPRDLREVPDLDDTGGGYRPPWRPQDPARDPREPGGGESSSAGTDHGWCNCTMASGAMALAGSTEGRLDRWGGDLRHHQGDLSGGTDLYDLQDAFESYGESLGIRSGKGWDALKADRAERRYLVVQGEGNVPGSETFDGGHACVVSPETHSDGRWLFGDPLASGWQWVSASSIRSWMEAWAGSGLAWARTVAPPPPPDPGPDPEPPAPPPPPIPDPDYGDGYLAGVEDGAGLAADAVFRSWRPGEPWPPDLSGPRWDGGTWGDGPWVRPWPYPLRNVLAATRPAAWGGSGWTAALWRDGADPLPDPGPLPAWDADAWAATWAA